MGKRYGHGESGPRPGRALKARAACRRGVQSVPEAETARESARSPPVVTVPGSPAASVDPDRSARAHGDAAPDRDAGKARRTRKTRRPREAWPWQTRRPRQAGRAHDHPGSADHHAGAHDFHRGRLDDDARRLDDHGGPTHDDRGLSRDVVDVVAPVMRGNLDGLARPHLRRE
jgi:hypothetical protein